MNGKKGNNVPIVLMKVTELKNKNNKENSKKNTLLSQANLLTSPMGESQTAPATNQKSN